MMIVAIVEARNTGVRVRLYSVWFFSSVTDRRHGCGKRQPGSRLRPELADIRPRVLVKGSNTVELQTDRPAPPAAQLD